MRGPCLLALSLFASGCGIVVIDGSGTGDTVPGSGGGGGASLGTSAGASGGSEPVGGAGSAPEACIAYCAEAAKLGCPPTGDCVGWCATLFDGACDDLLSDFLVMVSADLHPGCWIGFPDDDFDKVTTAHDNLLQCEYESTGPTCPEFGTEAVGPTNACHGGAKCQSGNLSMNCDDDGVCQCFKDAQLVGSCVNIASGTTLCFPILSCCKTLFML